VTMQKTESKRIGKANTLKMTLQTISRADEKSSELSTVAVDLEMVEEAMPVTLILIEEVTNLSTEDEAEADNPDMRGIMKILMSVPPPILLKRNGSSSKRKNRKILMNLLRNRENLKPPAKKSILHKIL